MFAHTIGADKAEIASFAWHVDPWILASLLVAAMLYARGILRLWHSAHYGAGVTTRHTVFFAAGLATVALALLSPIDTVGAELFSMHMVQHELLMLAAAPLIVCGRPLPVLVWAFPPIWRRRIAQAVRTGVIRQTWRALTPPLCAWSLHAVVLWTWHVPRLFQASLASDAVHSLQHVSFLLSALLFWSSLLGPYSRLRDGVAVLYLLSTAIHTGMLGVLLTFSPHVWYPAYAGTTGAWGLTALEDQQLGGLVMWVPAGFVFVFAALAAAARAIAPGAPCKPLPAAERRP